MCGYGVNCFFDVLACATCFINDSFSPSSDEGFYGKFGKKCNGQDQKILNSFPKN